MSSVASRVRVQEALRRISEDPYLRATVELALLALLVREVGLPDPYDPPLEDVAHVFLKEDLTEAHVSWVVEI